MKFLTSIILLLSIFTCFSEASTQSYQSSSPTVSAALDATIEAKMKESGIVGLGAAVIVDKKLAWAKGYGYADKQTNKPFTTETIMNIGSISKTFTGVSLMQAVETKKVSLDEDINKYLPFNVVNPHFPSEKITLRHLATHTSGLADRYPFYTESNYHYGGDSPEDLGDFLRNYFEPSGKYYSKENFLDKKPGTYRDYSNIASALAGLIVELATGEKLNAYSKNRIFKPLGMNSTGWFLSEIERNNHTKLYVKEAGMLKTIDLYGLTTYPDGGVRTTVLDLAKFYIALLNGGAYGRTRILRETSVQEMQRFHFTPANKPENVELSEINSGIFWATKRDTTLIGHAGSDPGIKTEMLSDPKKEVAVILFTNTGLIDRDLIKYHFGIFDDLYKYGVELKRSSPRR